jgi:outer membrane immunogenic protein
LLKFQKKLKMKKISLMALFVAVAATCSFAQGTLGKGGKQLNAGVGFSDWGVPVYVGMDFGVHESITIGPRFSYRNYGYRAAGFDVDQTLIVLSFNGNYHFNKILNLESKWDLYAGLTLGYYLWSDAKIDGNNYNGGKGSGIGLDAQIGARYFFSDKFGLNLEFGGGTGTGGSFGITYKF